MDDMNPAERLAKAVYDLDLAEKEFRRVNPGGMAMPAKPQDWEGSWPPVKLRERSEEEYRSTRDALNMAQDEYSKAFAIYSKTVKA